MRIVLFVLLLTSSVLAAPSDFQGDRVGPLTLGLSSAKVVQLVGVPKTKSTVTEEAATGLWVQDWSYPAKGLRLVMASDKPGAAQTLDRLEALRPSPYATKKGIRLGATRAQVEKAYGPFINREESGANSLVVGSIYGGLIFTFEKGRVSRIFLGAAAE